MSWTRLPRRRQASLASPSPSSTRLAPCNGPATRRRRKARPSCTLAASRAARANVVWHEEDRREIHPHDAEQRGIRDGDWVKLASRAGETTLRALITGRVAPGVVYTTFHHPATQANVVTTDFSDWATNCPEYKVTAVQVSRSNGPTDWQERYREQTEQSRRIIETVEAAE